MVFGFQPVGRLWQNKLRPIGLAAVVGSRALSKSGRSFGLLVQVDTHAAEEACLALLTRPEIRRAMGAAARQRAYETFHPNVVMSQIEALFLDLQERRQRLWPHLLLPVPS